MARPTRIAVVSDIHGNLMALDAVMTDLEEQDVDEVWCGGDIAWSGPWGDECIARVRSAGWRCVKGNTDVWITGDPQTVEDVEDRKKLMAMAEQHAISEDDAAWLLNLPMGHSGSGSVLLVHGTPSSPYVAPMPDAPSSEFEIYEGKAAMVVYGHVHRSFVRRLSDGTIVANTGSVGLPMDGPTACYMLLDLQGGQWTIRHRRVSFDRRACEAEAKRIGPPIGPNFLELFNMA